MTLWNFALALYARPGVERACLDAQEQGADVCLLLCGAWLDGRGVHYQAPNAAALRRLAGERQSALIQPLRNVRQQLREPAQRAPKLARLREQVKALELAAERQLLEELEELAQAWPQDPAGVLPDARAWLEALAEPLHAAHPSLQLIQRERLALDSRRPG